MTDLIKALINRIRNFAGIDVLSAEQIDPYGRRPLPELIAWFPPFICGNVTDPKTLAFGLEEESGFVISRTRAEQLLSDDPLVRNVAYSTLPSIPELNGMSAALSVPVREVVLAAARSCGLDVDANEPIKF